MNQRPKYKSQNYTILRGKQGNTFTTWDLQRFLGLIPNAQVTTKRVIEETHSICIHTLNELTTYVSLIL